MSLSDMAPGLPANIIRVDGTSMSPPFDSSRVALAFVVDLYLGLPICLGQIGRVGTSPVKLTGHFPEVNPPNTLTLERRLTAFVAARPAMRLAGRASL